MTTESLTQNDLASSYASILTLGEEAAAGAGDVLHDMEEEMLNAAHFVQSLRSEANQSSEVGQMDINMMKTIQDASKGVTEGTDAEYHRQALNILLL